jgi:hypothetical protein
MFPLTPKSSSFSPVHLASSLASSIIFSVQWRSNESQQGVGQHRHNRFTKTKMSECSYLLADQGYVDLKTIGEDVHLL